MTHLDQLQTARDVLDYMGITLQVESYHLQNHLTAIRLEFKSDMTPDLMLISVIDLALRETKDSRLVHVASTARETGVRSLAIARSYKANDEMLQMIISACSEHYFSLYHAFYGNESLFSVDVLEFIRRGCNRA